ncbi:hypothetical protein FACS1894172_18920 [Spirochaetia bacterium]|nr:hypothetical protein FACS1894164_18790 [Spirochaetia bacterium]GHU36235.1 hypothetical protein FACS1894172_18920 [Spirochaetia bacterium]
MAELIRKATGEWEVVEEQPDTASEILSKVSRLSVQNKKWILTLFKWVILAQNATKERICRQFGIDPDSVKLD